MKHRSRVACISAVLFLQACCRSFSVELDPSDVVMYGSGGGELGAPWVEVVVRGDGSVTYQETEGGVKAFAEVQMDQQEVIQLFQDLVDLGLFCMKPGLHGGGADVPVTKIEARIGGKELDAAFAGPREADDDSHISQIEARMRLFIRGAELGQPK